MAYRKGKPNWIVGVGPVKYYVRTPLVQNIRALLCFSSCPDLPAPCTWEDFNSSDPNPHILYGALVSGPDENDYYEDNRALYVYNDVSTDSYILTFILQGLTTSSTLP